LHGLRGIPKAGSVEPVVAALGPYEQVRGVGHAVQLRSAAGVYGVAALVVVLHGFVDRFPVDEDQDAGLVLVDDGGRSVVVGGGAQFLFFQCGH